MRLFFKFLRIASVLSACVGALVLTSPAQAADSGWYLGADVASLQTTLDYGYTETYNTSHARLKVGYQILSFLSVEGRVMTSGDDTDIDTFGGQYRFDTGNMIGFYARPHTNFQSANVYGILGLTAMNTKYRLVAPVTGPTDSDSVLAFTAGVGGTFMIVNNLTFDVEATMYVGSANYASYFADSVNLYSYGLSAGLRYHF